MIWHPIYTHRTDARKGPYSPHVFCAHDDKRWIRMGRLDPVTGRWYYSGTNERSQWACVEGDEPTHWAPIVGPWDEPAIPPPQKSAS